MKHEDLKIEGAGAVGVAALAAGRLDARGTRVAVVLSGANIDQELLSAIVADH